MDSSNDGIVANEEFNADFEYDRNEIDRYLHFTTQESFLGIKKVKAKIVHFDNPITNNGKHNELSDENLLNDKFPSKSRRELEEEEETQEETQETQESQEDISEVTSEVTSEKNKGMTQKKLQIEFTNGTEKYYTPSSTNYSHDVIVANEELNINVEHDRNEIDRYLHFTTQESFLGIKNDNPIIDNGKHDELSDENSLDDKFPSKSRRKLDEEEETQEETQESQEDIPEVTSEKNKGMTPKKLQIEFSNCTEKMKDIKCFIDKAKVSSTLLTHVPSIFIKKNNAKQMSICSNLTVYTDVSTSKQKLNISDSHTSYRRILEQEVMALKLKLVESQAVSDTNRVELKNEMLKNNSLNRQVSHLQDKSSEMEQNVKQLNTVIDHLQTNARLSAYERSSLQLQAKECLQQKSNMKFKFTAKYKEIKGQNKKYEKQMGELEKTLKEKNITEERLENELKSNKFNLLKGEIRKNEPQDGCNLNDREAGVIESHSKTNIKLPKKMEIPDDEKGRDSYQSFCRHSDDLDVFINHVSFFQKSCRESRKVVNKIRKRHSKKFPQHPTPDEKDLTYSSDDNNILNNKINISVSGDTTPLGFKCPSHEDNNNRYHQIETQHQKIPSLLSRWRCNNLGNKPEDQNNNIEDNCVTKTKMYVEKNDITNPSLGTVFSIDSDSLDKSYHNNLLQNDEIEHSINDNTTFTYHNDNTDSFSTVYSREFNIRDKSHSINSLQTDEGEYFSDDDSKLTMQRRKTINTGNCSNKIAVANITDIVTNEGKSLNDRCSSIIERVTNLATNK